jgi:hypothetical protein
MLRFERLYVVLGMIPLASSSHHPTHHRNRSPEALRMSTHGLRRSLLELCPSSPSTCCPSEQT